MRNWASVSKTKLVRPVEVKLPEAARKVKQVRSFNEHSLLLTEDGKVFGAGGNLFGQLGTGDTENRNTFVPINVVKGKKGKKIRSVVTGAYHSFLVTENDDLYSSGENSYGQLGLKNDVDRLHFEKVDFPKGKGKIKIKKVICGSCHTLILTQKNEVFATGGNSFGQCGVITKDFQMKSFNSFTKVVDFGHCAHKLVADIFCGRFHTFFVTFDHTVYSCGWNRYGQCGVGQLRNNVMKLEIVKKLAGKKVRKIEAGVHHTLFWLANGEIWACGNSENGVCGTQKTPISTPERFEIKGITPVNVVVGWNHTLVVEKTGLIFGVGNNKLAQLGVGDTEGRLNFTKIENFKMNLRSSDVLEKKDDEKIETRNMNCKDMVEISRNLEKLLKTGNRVLEYDIDYSKLNMSTRIGRGSVGDVFRYKLKLHSQELKEVAVKVFDETLVGKGIITNEMIKVEALQMISATHLNCIKCLGYHLKKHKCVIMELCEMSLEQMIVMKKLGSFRNKTKIIKQLADGILYLHKKLNLVHRDIKPDNVLVSSEGVVKIADFGASKKMGKLKSRMSHIHILNTKLVGTPFFMAPEIGGSEPIYDERCDVFSFGVLCFCVYFEKCGVKEMEELLYGGYCIRSQEKEIEKMLIKGDWKPKFPKDFDLAKCSKEML